jgi:hypothetical protein
MTKRKFTPSLGAWAGTFMFLFAGSVAGQDPEESSKVLMEYWKPGSSESVMITSRVQFVEMNVDDVLQNHKQYEQAKDALTSHVLSPALVDYSDELISKLSDYRISEASCLILGRLNIDDELKQSLLSSEITPLVVRARLGDIEAQKEVIKHFQSAASIIELRRRCEDLLYVGSADAMSAFGDALESDVVMDSAGGASVSELAILVQCWRKTDPDNLLLSYRSMEDHRVACEEDFLKEKHQMYMLELERYFTIKLGRKVKVRAPYLMFGFNKSISIRPIRLQKRENNSSLIESHTNNPDN